MTAIKAQLPDAGLSARTLIYSSPGWRLTGRGRQRPAALAPKRR